MKNKEIEDYATLTQRIEEISNAEHLKILKEDKETGSLVVQYKLADNKNESNLNQV